VAARGTARTFWCQQGCIVVLDILRAHGDGFQMSRSPSRRVESNKKLDPHAWAAEAPVDHQRRLRAPDADCER
jgi:hypothetical protein